MDNPYSPDPKVINAVRSPLGMGALIVLVLTLIMGAVLFTSLPIEVKELCLAVYAAGLFVVGLWTGIMGFINPRHLAYGPRELLENNRIDHEHNLAMRKLELEHREK
jgi:hypothetical protein